MVFYDEPIQTVLVTCRGESNVLGKEITRDNIITVDWHMPASFKPALYAISVGKDRFSLDIIRSSKCFVINFMDYEQKDSAMICGRTSGVHSDKFHKTGLKKIESEKIDCPRIEKALAYLECEVINEVEAGDHIIFVSRIIGGEQIDDGKRLFHTTGDNFLRIE